MDISEAIARARAADAQFEEHGVTLSGLDVVMDDSTPAIGSGAPALTIDGRDFELRSKGMDRLCRFLKIPAEYIANLPRGLQATLIRHHLSGRHGPAEVGLITCESELVGLVRSDLARLTGQEVLEAVVNGTSRPEGDLGVVALEIRDESLHFDMVVHGSACEVAPGRAANRTAGIPTCPRRGGGS